MTEESHFTTTVKTTTGSAKFVFRLPISFVLQFRVTLLCTKGPHEGEELPNYVFFYRDQTKIVFETRLNFSGEFLITFFCRHEPTDDLDEEEKEMITYCEFACYKLVSKVDITPRKHKKLGADFEYQVKSDAQERLLGPQRSAMEYLNLSFIDHESGYFRVHESGNLIIRIYGAETLEFRYELTKDHESFRKYCSLVLGDADDRNHTYFRCRFPETGEYFLKLYGKYPSGEDPDWTMFAFYMIRVPHPSKRKHFSPKCNAGFFGLSPKIDKTILVTHKSPYFFTKENKLLITLLCEEHVNEVRISFSYLDVTQGSRGQMVAINNLMFYDKYLPEKRHIQCDIEMMSRGVHVLEIFRRKKTVKMVPKPLDPDQELLKILDDVNENQDSTSINSAGMTNDLMEVTEVEDKYLMTYGIDYIGPEIPNSEVNEYPDILANWTGSCKLFEPRMRFLPALKTILFRLAVPWAKEVRVKGRSMTVLECEKRGIFSYNVLVGMYSQSVVVQVHYFIRSLSFSKYLIPRFFLRIVSPIKLQRYRTFQRSRFTFKTCRDQISLLICISRVFRTFDCVATL